jgi:hypothetical protein
VAAYDYHYLQELELSVAMTADLDAQLRTHFRHDSERQEDITFAVWRPIIGSPRLTAVLRDLLPRPGESILSGNVSFTADYLSRVLKLVPEGSGIALLLSHLGPGWQGMSRDDDVAERNRLASAVAAQRMTSDRPVTPVGRERRRTRGAQARDPGRVGRGLV